MAENDWSGLARWAKRVMFSSGDEPWQYDRENELDDLACEWVVNDRIAFAADERMREKL